LKEDWTWKQPGRIFGQRTAQSILIKNKKENIDFADWNKDLYIAELLKVAESEDAVSEYQIKEFVKQIEKMPGQYLVAPYLSTFSKLLKRYRSNDDRTMYVGITEVNIYSGDNNYVFSSGYTGGSSKASILSYHMMLAKTLSEEYQSRQRLTERIAKELVPASLKQLGIPRSTDPTCPYSYSSGVKRLDQKTTTLSEPVKQALKKLKI
jgi:predicted Zn-dependent protease